MQQRECPLTFRQDAHDVSGRTPTKVPAESTGSPSATGWPPSPWPPCGCSTARLPEQPPGELAPAVAELRSATAVTDDRDAVRVASTGCCRHVDGIEPAPYDIRT